MNIKDNEKFVKNNLNMMDDLMKKTEKVSIKTFTYKEEEELVEF